MKKILLIGFILLLSFTYAQQKHWVYFEDKGVTETEFIENKKAHLKTAEILLSKRTIERRKKVMGKDYITFEDLPVNQSYINQIQELGFKVHRILNWFNAISVSSENAQISKLKDLPFVEEIREVKILKFKNPSSQHVDQEIEQLDKSQIFDLNYGNSFGQNEQHDIPIVHNTGYSGDDVVIGFLDSGFRWQTHPVFSTLNVLYEYDYINNDPVTANQDGDHPAQDSHGTSVLSLAVGYQENQLIGPAFSSSVMLSKTEDITSETRVEEDNFVKAVEDMEALGADIISASLGYGIFFEDSAYTFEDMDGRTTEVTKAYNKAFERGVVTVNSAGNEGNNKIYTHINAPADAFNVIAVGNVDSTGKLHPTSSPGPTYDGRLKPEVVARGVKPYYATASGRYSDESSGTSFSAPIVAGMIAQLLSAYPHLTNVQVREIVIRSGDNFENPNNRRGYGLLSAKKLLNYPNVMNQNELYTLNKMFLGEDLSDTPFIHIEIDGQWQSYELNKSDNIYPFVLPSSVSTGERIDFYYSYTNTTGELVREPADKNYSLTLPELKIDFVSGIINQPAYLPVEFELFQNYPNPFNLETTIEFYSESEQFAALKIYNILGQEIKSLFEGRVLGGINKLKWDGRNESGNIVAAGPYFYRLFINGNQQSKKMILLK